MACNLNFIVKNKGVLTVKDSHVHFKSSVLKTVLELNRLIMTQTSRLLFARNYYKKLCYCATRLSI